MKKGVLHHPGRWIWLPLIILAAVGAGRLRFDTDVFDLLPSDLPVVQGLKLYQEHFANARDLVITLRGTNAESVESAASAIALRLRPMTNLVASVVWEAPWLEQPDKMAELLAYLWFNQPPPAFHSLLDRFETNQLAATLSDARDQLATALSPQEIARLSYDPVGLSRLPQVVAGAAPEFGQGGGMFQSADGAFRIVFVRARTALPNYQDCMGWLDVVEPAVASAVASVNTNTSAPIEVGYTGRPAFVTEVAAGMKHDILFSVGGTSAVIAILFYLAHRRIRPMAWLLVLLGLVLGVTLALGGLIYGTINVLSVGFAAILLGLAVDYAVVHYQEALAHPELSIPQIRSAIAPSIFWAAVTTISAFLVLNFGGLPGLGQLGTLVGLGVAVAAAVMIFEYLPPLFPGRQYVGQNAEAPHAQTHPRRVSPARVRTVLGLTGVLVLVGAVILSAGGAPPIDSTANALRPRHSPAYAAMDEIAANLNQAHQPLWLIVDGATTAEVADRLARAEAVLNQAKSNGAVTGFTLPTALWPRPEFQEANRGVARQLGADGPLLRAAGRAAGFAPRSLALAEGMMGTWRRAGSEQGVFWPTNQLSAWILDKATARTSSNSMALGLVNANPAAGPGDAARLSGELSRIKGVRLAGWEWLGRAIFSRVKHNFWKVISPMVCLVLLSLGLAFRRLSEVLLGLAVLLLGGLCLLSVMRLAGWSWNLLDLMAVPLALGTGVDYAFFSQLALRRHDGDLTMAYRSVGRALLLCGGTAVAAFASLAFSANAGMASLGELCATSIGANMLIAVFLLPVWWHKLAGKTVDNERMEK